MMLWWSPLECCWSSWSLSLTQDIRNQRRYRQRRRQEKKKLQATLDSLHGKSQFYEEQIDYYNQYIKVCLDNLAKKGKYVQGRSFVLPPQSWPKCVGHFAFLCAILEIFASSPSPMQCWMTVRQVLSILATLGSIQVSGTRLPSPGLGLGLELGLGKDLGSL